MRERFSLDDVFEAIDLKEEILNLQLLLGVASATPVGEANPIDWDETAKELETLRRRLGEIIPGGSNAVDTFLAKGAI